MTIRQMLRKLRKDRALIDQAIAVLELLENGRRAERVAPRRSKRKLVGQEKKNGTEGLVIPFSSAQQRSMG